MGVFSCAMTRFHLRGTVRIFAHILMRKAAHAYAICLLADLFAARRPVKRIFRRSVKVSSSAR